MSNEVLKFNNKDLILFLISIRIDHDLPSLGFGTSARVTHEDIRLGVAQEVEDPLFVVVSVGVVVNLVDVGIVFYH